MKIYYKTLATIAISAMLSACSANSESADNQELNDSTTTKTEELPKIDIKQVSYNQVAQDNEYTATVEADNSKHGRIFNCKADIINGSKITIFFGY